MHWVAGDIGAALAIGLLYTVGLSLLTGVSFASALAALKALGRKILGLALGLWDRRGRRPEPGAKRSRTGAA